MQTTPVSQVRWTTAELELKKAGDRTTRYEIRDSDRPVGVARFYYNLDCVVGSREGADNLTGHCLVLGSTKNVVLRASSPCARG